jgi:tetratricopeptide (TPR) repeat protein
VDDRAAIQAALDEALALLRAQPDDLDALFERAALLAALGQDDAASAAYLDLLRRDDGHFGALANLGGLALKGGHRSAALSCYRQAVAHHPKSGPARVNLANLLLEDGELTEAREHYEAALAADPDLPEANQGLGLLLFALGEDGAADVPWRKGFTGRSLVPKPYRGEGPPVRVLLVVSARGGNIPTAQILDDKIFAVTALYAEFHDPALPLPGHDVVFNAVGDAELCGEALAGAAAVIARTSAPVLNPPEAVSATDRATNARRLAGIDGLKAPTTIRASKAALLADPGLKTPILLRSPGFHTGQNFLRIGTKNDLIEACKALPGEDLLAIEPLDACGADGLFRKYRVMMIEGELFALHMAASRDWKVHYFTADMAQRPDLRAEEAAFLERMPQVLGARAMSALSAVQNRMGLDYAGIDFGLSRDGEVLLFEANATMAIIPPEPDPMWDYRRAPIERALKAAQAMLRRCR